MMSFVSHFLTAMIAFVLGMVAMMLLSAAKDRENELTADEHDEHEDMALDAQAAQLPPAPRNGQPMDLGEVPAFLRRQAE